MTNLQGLTITLEDLTTAFVKWEKDYRTAPTNYSTQEEVSGLDVVELAAQRSKHFMRLLKEGKE